VIKLGDKVKCKLSGFIGVACARTEFINGCIQYEVLPKAKKSGEMPESVGIDEQSLEIIGKKKEIKKKTTGGPMSKGKVTRGF